MRTSIRKHVYWLIVCVVIIAFSAIMGAAIKRDFGKVEVQSVRLIDDSGGVVSGNLFRPKAATLQNKMPGVLNMSGYQHDKNATNSFSIELARRGFVVLAVDFLGHGDSDGNVQLVRFMFGKPDDPYSCGMNAAYHYLKSLPFVDAANLGLIGHSMGGVAAQKVASMNPDHRAINPYATFLIGIPGLKNFLYTMDRYDEFDFFREGQLRTEGLINNPKFVGRFGLTAPIQWDTTYGDFSQGTARRMAYIQMEHHFTPLTNKAVAEAVDWMRLSLKGGQKDASWIEPTSQIFKWHEFFGLITFLVTMLSLIPLTNILLAANFFGPVAQPMPSRYVPSTGTWWTFATINTLIGLILFPPLTGLVFLVDRVVAILPFMKLQIGNGTGLWFLANAIVCAILFFIWYRTSAKKAGVTMYDMGVSFDKEKTKFDWGILGKTLLVGGILFAWMYVLEGISQWALGQEFRAYMPFMRQFSSPLRFGLFWIYLIPALAFFLINGGILLFGQLRQKAYDSPAKTQWIWWLKILYAALAGLFLLLAFQYLPMYFGPGYGLEVVGIPGLPQYSAMWPLILQVYIPVFAFLLFLLTWFFRRTGRIYLGALMISSLWIWWLAAGSVIGP